MEVFNMSILTDVSGRMSHILICFLLHLLIKLKALLKIYQRQILKTINHFKLFFSEMFNAYLIISFQLYQVSTVKARKPLKN